MDAQTVPRDDPTALVDAVRAGDYLRTRAAALAASPAGLRSVTPAVRRLHRLLGAAAHGDTSDDGAWHGGSAEHYECATLALMACLGPDRAARLSAVPRSVAADLPLVLPDDLERVVETWSELFWRSPKAWDRVAHYPVMFRWVSEGLVAAPTSDGAVNLLLQELSHHPRRYSPERDRALFSATLPRLFVAGVKPSLGAASVDSHLPPGDAARIDELVLRLVRRGVWDAEVVADLVREGLAVRESAFQRRWLSSLQRRLPDVGR